ncbi:hypothetical protein BCPG1_190 [Bacillus phage BCPG1]|nr:hypothetical protein BCPG1_190 [Bacillus phage BCPG1]
MKVNKDISKYSDKKLSEEITTLEYIIRRSKDKLSQLRAEEHRRDNVKDNVKDYFSKGIVGTLETAKRIGL